MAHRLTRLYVLKAPFFFRAVYRVWCAWMSREAQICRVHTATFFVIISPELRCFKLSGQLVCYTPISTKTDAGLKLESFRDCAETW